MARRNVDNDAQEFAPLHLFEDTGDHAQVFRRVPVRLNRVNFLTKRYQVGAGGVLFLLFKQPSPFGALLLVQVVQQIGTVALQE